MSQITPYPNSVSAKEQKRADYSRTRTSKSKASKQQPQSQETGDAATMVFSKLTPAQVKQVVAAFQEDMTFTDHRQQYKVEYSLPTLFFIIVLGWLCGYRTALGLATFVEKFRDDLMELFLDYDGAQISHDTFNRILSNCVVSDIEGFLMAFGRRLLEQYLSTENKLIGVHADGQVIRGAHGDTARICHVTLYCPAIGASVGQGIAGTKENEQVALRRAFKKLDVTKCLVITGDAMHTQIETAKQLVESGDHFLFCVKKNQKGLLTEVERLFSDGRYRRQNASEEAECVSGRITEREASVIDGHKLDVHRIKRGSEWLPLIKTVIKIERYNEIKNIKTKVKYRCDGSLVEVKDSRPDASVEVAYYISSIPYYHPNVAHEIMSLIREHWSVENEVHWWADYYLNQDRDLKIKNETLAANCVALNRFVADVYEHEKRFIREHAVTSTQKQISRSMVMRTLTNDLMASLTALARYCYRHILEGAENSHA